LATLASVVSELIVGVETKNGSCDPDHTSFRRG